MRGVACCLVLLVCGSGWAQEDGSRKAELRRRVAESGKAPALLREVVLDAVVTDAKGHPVTGLKTADFSVLEDGVGQRIVSVVEHGPERMAASPVMPPNVFTNRPAARTGSASTVMLFDVLDSQAAAVAYVRGETGRALKTVAPATVTAAAQLGTTMMTIQGMTEDREVLRGVLAGPGMGLGGDVQLGTPYSSGDSRDAMRRQVFRDGMEDLAGYWRDYPGRKNLVWFTAQVPIDLAQSGPLDPFPDEVETTVEGGVRSEVLTLSQLAVYPVDMHLSSSGLAMGGAGRGGMGEGTVDRRRALADVAAKTGGKVFDGGGDLRSTLEHLFELGSHFYTVTYQPAKTTTDGGYRALKVQVVRGDLSVASRQGYYARAEWAVEKDMAPTELHAQSLKNAAMRESAMVRSGIIFRATVKAAPEVKRDAPGTVPTDGNVMVPKLREKGYRYFGIDFQVEAGGMHFVRSADGLYRHKVEFVSVLYDEQGQKVNGIGTRLTQRLEESDYERVQRTGMAVTQKIAVPLKGRYVLRMAVFEIGGPGVGVIEIPVGEIPWR